MRPVRVLNSRSGELDTGEDRSDLRRAEHSPRESWERGVVKSRIMYVELKTGYNDNGPAWIGRVAFSKTGQTIYYRGKSLRRIRGGGISANYRDVETGEQYWVSGVKKNGEDRHWAGAGPVEIDEDVRGEYERLVTRPK